MEPPRPTPGATPRLPAGAGRGRHELVALGALIAAALLMLNVAVGVTAGLFLKSRRDAAERTAAMLTHDVACALAGSVNHAAQVTRLALRVLAAECTREVARHGRIDPVALRADFALMRRSLPAGTMLHVTDRSGRVIVGFGGDQAHAATHADRDFLQALMPGPDTGRIRVTDRLLGRTAHVAAIAFVARYDHPTGDAAGLVSLAIPLAYFQQLLRAPGLGPHGIALMRGAGTPLPALDPASTGKAIGSTAPSRDFHATRTANGVERIDAFQRLRDVPFVLVVGKAATDYLAGWSATRRWVLLAQAAFLAVSLAFAATLWRAARRLDRIKRDEALRARRDVLTGLPNRRALLEYLPRALARARRLGTAVAVGLLDLDEFKSINDRFGHSNADQLLSALGQRMVAVARRGEFVARLGGDEFVLVFESLTSDQVAEQLGSALARFDRVFDEAFELGDGVRVSMRMTLGVALFPGDGTDAATLLRRADAAMYTVKRRRTGPRARNAPGIA